MAKVKDTIDSINASINGNGGYLTKTEKQETPKKENAFNKLLDLQLIIQIQIILVIKIKKKKMSKIKI